MYGAIETKRVNAGVSPTSSASTVSPYRLAASALDDRRVRRIAVLGRLLRGLGGRRRRRYADASGIRGEQLAALLERGRMRAHDADSSSAIRPAPRGSGGSAAPSPRRSTARARRAGRASRRPAPASELSIGSTPCTASSAHDGVRDRAEADERHERVRGRAPPPRRTVCDPGRPWIGDRIAHRRRGGIRLRNPGRRSRRRPSARRWQAGLLVKRWVGVGSRSVASSRTGAESRGVLMS